MSRLEGKLTPEFFTAQATLTPELAGQEDRYLILASLYQKMLEEKAGEIGVAWAPLGDIDKRLEQNRKQLHATRRLLEPDPVLDMAHGGWRRSLNRARINLHDALLRNTVPWPLMLLARRLAWVEHPEILDLSRQNAQLNLKKGKVSETATTNVDQIERDFRDLVASSKCALLLEENRLLSGYERNVAYSAQVEDVGKYLTNLPESYKSRRAISALITFVDVNAAYLLETTQLNGFKEFIEERADKSVAVRLHTFVDKVEEQILSSTGSGRVFQPEEYRALDGYATRRWEAYLVYSANRQLHKVGILPESPDIPQLFHK